MSGEELDAILEIKREQRKVELRRRQYQFRLAAIPLMLIYATVAYHEIKEHLPDGFWCDVGSLITAFALFVVGWEWTNRRIDRLTWDDVKDPVEHRLIDL
jgi:hypothetical protein